MAEGSNPFKPAEDLTMDEIEVVMQGDDSVETLKFRFDPRTRTLKCLSESYFIQKTRPDMVLYRKWCGSIGIAGKLTPTGEKRIIKFFEEHS